MSDSVKPSTDNATGKCSVLTSHVVHQRCKDLVLFQARRI